MTRLYAALALYVAGAACVALAVRLAPEVFATADAVGRKRERRPVPAGAWVKGGTA